MDGLRGEDRQGMSEEQFQNVQARKASDTYFERGLNSSTNCHSGYHEDCMMRGCSCMCHAINRPAMNLPTSADRLEASIKTGEELGKVALYFGCWNQAGHYLQDHDGRTLYRNERNHPSDLPWNEGMMDGTLLHNGKISDVPNGKVYWTCGGKDGFWYAFYWWDRSVDTRGACNSSFYVRGFGYPEMQEAFDWACTQFPSVVSRQKFPLMLQIDWRKENRNG